MRVAILLSGQMRRFTEPAVLQSFHAFSAQFDVADIFISTWSNRGVSYNHGQIHHYNDESNVITENHLRSCYPQTRFCAIHSLQDWEDALVGCRKQVYTEGFEWYGMKIRGSVVPQLFGIYDANRLRLQYEKEHNISYDLVFRCRPDAIFAPHSRSFYESAIPNTIYAINNMTSGAFYPQRIYDIFFFGTPNAMNSLCDAYNSLEELIAYPWQNGLHPRDACRCLYVQARFFHGSAVIDIPYDICKVLR